MQNKLQELTDKLYNEGVSKGKTDAEEIKTKAKADAVKIVSDAKDEAARIISEAKKQAEDIRFKVENDVKMASVQTISATRQQIENLLVTKGISANIKDAISNVDFIKSVILTIVKAYDPTNPQPMDLNLILPASMEKELSSYMENEYKKLMSNGLTIKFSKQVSEGFKISPKEGGYFISFTAGDFEKILSDYLRPTTKKILFGI